ncbi:PAS domain S-box protein [Ancylobacter sp. 6x-1]|uniref:histidine kinase n=1 Tax=Ancylobacter crimeensis TaxID=2579147 RepID=A0ABT0D5U1_9HYPH|nr:PAS domain S-box protein [Ancylobacter crimeensis]MCK0195309.1 PAS domain S-box protein [Ancylobacter crimeensis]
MRAADPARVFPGSSELAGRVRDFRWDETSLGPIAQWPAAVRSVVAMMLLSPLPIVTLWGEDGVMIYNDAYSVFAGERHPRLLGSRVREGWPEVADFNDNVVRTVFGRGETLSYENQQLYLDRGRGPEPVWLNLDYSPVVDEEGHPLGVIAIVVETTEKVFANRQFEEERQRLEQMYQQSASFMALLEGPAHRFKLVNPAYRELIGGRDVVGQTVADALPEAVAQGYVDILDEVFRGGRPYRSYQSAFDLDVAGIGTQRRYVDFIYQPIVDLGGHVTSIFVNGIDVTDGVAVQEALRASEAQFRTFAQVLPNQAWAASADGLLDWFNERVSAYSGRKVEDLRGKGWLTIIHPEDRDRAQAEWQAALEGGESYETEFRIRRADGAYRWHLVRALPVRIAEGSVTRWIGTNTDIHEQKLIEAESLRDRDRIWNLSPVLKVVASGTGQVTAVNPAWTRALGWTEEETVGRNVLDFVAAESRDAANARLDELRRSDVMTQSESVLLAKGGTVRRVAWTSVSENGVVYAFGRDITAETEAAAALAKSEAALLQSQKMEAIGQLTGGIAHDFNNLLQVVSGNLQLLAGDIEGNTRAEQRARNAMEGVHRGARLASQLLAFSRRQPLAPKVVNLARLVRGMDEILRRALGEAIEVETIINGGLWNTFVDPGNVENALLNLAINARDAMDGQGKLTIETGNAYLDELYSRSHVDVVPGQYVLLAVTDTGAGMPPEIMAKVFDPFFTTKPEGKGTGLGLSMVYGFVKQSGGHVAIYSEPGEGTTVKIYLPRSTRTEDERVLSDEGPVKGGSETILVVEDDRGVRETVVETLRGLGYRVLQAPDPAAALVIVESGVALDLVFTDVVMPGPIKATELARAAVARLPGVKVLFTSGYTENAIVHAGRLDDGVELIGKPYTREALAGKLRQLLGNRSASLAQTAPTPSVAESLALPKGNLTVLICEDDMLIRFAILDMLEELGHVGVEAGDAHTALGFLVERKVDVLMTDLGLPDMSGIELVRRARELHPHLPVMFATGQMEVEGTSEDGETVILTKPFGTGELAAAIGRLSNG